MTAYELDRYLRSNVDCNYLSNENISKYNKIILLINKIFDDDLEEWKKSKIKLTAIA